MPIWLRRRKPDLQEAMDAPDCPPDWLANTYRDFAQVNQRVSGWERIFHRHIRPVLSEPHRTYTLLDIGFGGGDIPLLLHNLAARCGVQLRIHAIDPDPRALAYVASRRWPDTIEFSCATPASLLAADARYDVVISNHVLHHLPDAEVAAMMRDAGCLARRRVCFNDLARSDWAWILFGLGTAGRFPRSYIRSDGLRSIQRAFTQKELQQLVPAGWLVHRTFPFHLLAVGP